MLTVPPHIYIPDLKKIRSVMYMWKRERQNALPLSWGCTRNLKFPNNCGSRILIQDKRFPNTGVVSWPWVTPIHPQCQCALPSPYLAIHSWPLAGSKPTCSPLNQHTYDTLWHIQVLKWSWVQYLSFLLISLYAAARLLLTQYLCLLFDHKVWSHFCRATEFMV